MKKEIIIFGTGGHAKVVFDIILKENKYKPIAFLSLDKSIKTFLDLPHYHQDDLTKYNFSAGVIAVGDNFVRSELAKVIMSKISNFEFVTTIHPSAQIGLGVKFGKGTIVMANSVINPYCEIADHVIINTSSSIDHDCHISSYASIAPGAVLGGNVKIGSGTAVSLGANIIHGITIGTKTVIGAGALVLTNIESNVVAYGSPCKIIKVRKEDEKYL